MSRTATSKEGMSRSVVWSIRQIRFPSGFRINTSPPTSYPTRSIGTRLSANRSTLKNDFGGDLLLANDTWFRPIDCAVARMGSVFIADWYDETANHVDPRDDWDKSNGRIYELVADGTQPVKPFDLAKLSSLELVEMLHHKNDWFGREARRILAARRDPAVIPPLKKIVLESDDDDLALRAFWMLYVSGGFNDALAEKLLDHRSERYSHLGDSTIGRHQTGFTGAAFTSVRSGIDRCESDRAEPIGVHGQTVVG